MGSAENPIAIDEDEGFPKKNASSSTTPTPDMTSSALNREHSELFN